MKVSGKTLWQVFLSFFKIGAFTFGGGYAMIPLIQNEAVEQRHWVTDDDILEVVAIAESTPGPIAINCATFVGYKAAGVLGFVLRQFRELEAVRYAFFGIRAGVLALLVKALWTMYRKSPKGWVSYVVMAASFVLTAVFDLNVIFVIIGCAVFGVVTSFYLERRGGK